MLKWHERLRFARQSQGWTQSLLAEKIGTTVQSINRWENGNVFPSPFYREKLTELFGPNFEELESFSALPENGKKTRRKYPKASAIEDLQIDPDELQDLWPAETLKAMSDPSYHQQCSPFSGKHALQLDSLQGTDEESMQPEKQDICASESLPSTATQREFSLPQTIWDIDLRDRGRVPLSRPSNHFLRHPLFIGTVILLIAQIIIAVLWAFILLPLSRSVSTEEMNVSPSPKTTSGQDNYSPPAYILTIQNVNPKLQNTAQHLQKAFKAVYPQLVKRFALNPDTIPHNVTLTFSSNSSSPANISGTTITLRSDWIEQHPSDMGLLTSELTLLLERYPSGTPTWFSDGVADYARYIYGPADDDDWSLSDGVQSQKSYTQGGKVAVGFLVWLEQNTRLDIVDQLNHALQTKQSFSAVFYRLTHHTVDELWRRYQAQPDITLTPQQLYKTVMSRKSLYRSSFHLQASDGNARYAYAEDADAQGLYLSNFAIQADITIVHGGAAVGFFFRSEDDINYRSIYLYMNGSYSVSNHKQVVISGFSSAIKEGPNQTNRLTIIAQKHTFYMYINGQFFVQLNDNSSSYGTVGPMILAPKDPADVQYNNLQVF